MAGKKPTLAKKPAAKKAAKKPGPPATAQAKLEAAGIDSIAGKIADGISYREIAKEFGVGLATLATWIEGDPERSRVCARAREMSAQAFDEMALEELDGASDMFELSKAKEKAAHYRWRAKAANPKRYGEKVGVGQADGLDPVGVIQKIERTVVDPANPNA